VSRSAAITRDWADGTYTFRLGWGQWELLQEACGCGPWYLQALFFNTALMVQNPDGVKELQPRYVAEVIRAGLIGGGTEPSEALRKVRTYVHERPPRENFALAMEIIQAGLDGAPDEDAERQKKSESPTSETLSPEDGSVSPTSTASEPPSGSRRRK
jgi:hypothetical protein